MKKHFFIDTETSAVRFFFAKFTKQHSLSMVKLAYLYKLKLVNNNLILIVTYYTQLHF